MFKPKTLIVDHISKFPSYQKRTNELEKFFDKPTIVYIDFANVYKWSNKLKWHTDIRRLKQFLDSFSNVKEVRLYQGTLVDDKPSELFITQATKLGYKVITKDVKIMRLSIDVSSISKNNPVVIENFIKKSFLKNFKLDQIEYINNILEDLNRNGLNYIEHRKCNFDVEMGVDMILDSERGNSENFIVWSSDSDFADPIKKLIDNGKKVILFATSRKVTKELDETNALIFDVKKIKDFICRRKEIKKEIKVYIKQKGLK